MLEVEDKATGSGYHLQVEMEQRHMDSRSRAQVRTDNENVLSVSVLYLFSSSVYPVHQLISTVTLLIQVQLQLSNPVLQNKAVTSVCLVSDSIWICFL